MSFLNTLSWPSWLILAGVPMAIIALYFLKLRRQPLEIPSTYLWSRTIEDLHVNSLWQRLRQSLLLFLQLLLIALAILACLRPGWRGTKLAGDRFIFMLDTSASMSATDVEPTRLEFAKRRVLEMINQMKSGDVAMVISFSDGVPRVEQPFTGIRGLLRQKVNRIGPTSRRTDLSGALRTAAGLANPGRTRNVEDAGDVPVADALPATLYIYSDGGFASVSDFSLGNLDPVYIRIGTDSPQNVGVVAFSADRNPARPGRTQAFARLENSVLAEVSVDVDLYLNDELVDASNVTVPAGGETGVQFELKEVEEGSLRVELAAGDHLSLDDTAYAALGVTRRARALIVTPRNDALRLAASTDEAAKFADVTFATPEEAAGKKVRDLAVAGAYDLVIYDQCVPKQMPQANTLFIGNVPPIEGWSRGELKTLPIIIDTDRAHPLTYLVEMGGVRYIYQGFSVQAPEGSTVLFDSNIGPLLVICQRDGFEDVAMGFEIIGKDDQGEVIPKTDWVARRSFPVFVMNALRYLGGLTGSLAATGVQPG
ncbi:MAG: BatA and WFA domain-containing protein, partial [Pirellulaceae bacterium]